MKPIRRDLDWVASDIISSYDAAVVEHQIDFWTSHHGWDIGSALFVKKMGDGELTHPGDVEELYRDYYGDDFIIENWGR